VTKKKLSISERIREQARKNLKFEKSNKFSHLSTPSEEENSVLPKYLQEWLSGEKTGFDPKRYSENRLKKTPSKDAVRVLLLAPEEERSDLEINRLVQTLGINKSKVIFFNSQAKKNARFLIPKSAIDKAVEFIDRYFFTAVVVDAELSPSQIRNLEAEFKKPVLERQAVILAIFQKHASSKLAKSQVEIAQLKYLSARLSGLWMGLSRQRGAAGGLGGRGLGEKKLELDRRTIQNRIHTLEKSLVKAEIARKIQSKERQSLPRVALVGYTNAGKSSLMSHLTQYESSAKDELFHTLDTVVKTFQPLTSPKILVSDTIGFINKLPHDLMAAFKATLAEAKESSLIIHVVDISHNNWFQQFTITEKVLEELEITDVKKLLVLNKQDVFLGKKMFDRRNIEWKLRTISSKYQKRIFTSCTTGEGISLLKQNICENLSATMKPWLLNSKE